MINREGFVRDAELSNFSQFLTKQYLALVNRRVTMWIDDLENSKGELTQTIESLKPYLLILDAYMPANQDTSELRQIIENAIEKICSVSDLWKFKGSDNVDGCQK